MEVMVHGSSWEIFGYLQVKSYCAYFGGVATTEEAKPGRALVCCHLTNS